jgi:hypothetical protein
VQTAHACIEAARHFIPPQVEHPHLIILSADSELHLHKIKAKLEAEGIPHKGFYEPDMGNQLTALATAPISGQSRNFFKKYKLLNPAVSSQPEPEIPCAERSK